MDQHDILHFNTKESSVVQDYYQITYGQELLSITTALLEAK